jgi:hypothetical protein
VSGAGRPGVAATPPVLYQESVSRALADVKLSLRRQHLDPLRYLVDIDAGLALFAPRPEHQLRIAYNRHEELAMECAIPHAWLIEPAGDDHDRFVGAVDELVSSLKTRVQASGRPL